MVINGICTQCCIMTIPTTPQWWAAIIYHSWCLWDTGLFSFLFTRALQARIIAIPEMKPRLRRVTWLSYESTSNRSSFSTDYPICVSDSAVKIFTLCMVHWWDVYMMDSFYSLCGHITQRCLSSSILPSWEWKEGDSLRAVWLLWCLGTSKATSSCASSSPDLVSKIGIRTTKYIW